jgi:hypothetical protein
MPVGVACRISSVKAKGRGEPAESRRNVPVLWERSGNLVLDQSTTGFEPNGSLAGWKSRSAAVRARNPVQFRDGISATRPGRRCLAVSASAGNRGAR